MFINLLNNIGHFLYPFFIAYLWFIDLSYIYFKTIKKDGRFEDVGLFKYIENPIKTLRGDFKC